MWPADTLSLLYTDTRVSHSVGPHVIGRGNNRRPETIIVKGSDCMEPSRRLTLSGGDTDALTH